MTGTSDDRRYAWRVLSVTGIGVLLSGANTSTLDVALPTVARHFDATATEASWMLLSYMLVSTGLIVAFGRLADIVGRRRLYLVGLAVFTVAGWRAASRPTPSSSISCAPSRRSARPRSSPTPPRC